MEFDYGAFVGGAIAAGAVENQTKSIQQQTEELRRQFNIQQKEQLEAKKAISEYIKIVKCKLKSFIVDEMPLLKEEICLEKLPYKLRVVDKNKYTVSVDYLPTTVYRLSLYVEEIQETIEVTVDAHVYADSEINSDIYCELFTFDNYRDLTEEELSEVKKIKNNLIQHKKNNIHFEEEKIKTYNDELTKRKAALYDEIKKNKISKIFWGLDIVSAILFIASVFITPTTPIPFFITIGLLFTFGCLGAGFMGNIPHKNADVNDIERKIKDSNATIENLNKELNNLL